ncbi:uncharacterized protein [Typha angustifolia]|uniref:uncharacterized protein n=1 Tax=Typha angustifolia TaxID=59011 RepID=UPI003C2BF62B
MEKLRWSIEMEPRTLNVGELNNAREEAMEIQEKEPMEASNIFTEGMKGISTIEEKEKELERQNNVHRLMEIKEESEVCSESWDASCSWNNAEEHSERITRRETLSSPF